MNVGITSVGIYIPYYRLKRETIARAWERRALKGEKSVANTDEDSLTMAVESAINCFRHIDRGEIDALLFASTTAPYAEKSHSSLVATVCDLKSDVFTADFAHSTKAGSSALKAAIDAVTAQSAKQALVTAADCPVGYPKSDQEQLMGDASAAVVVGRDNVIAEIVSSFSVNNEIIDVWRNYGERYVRTAEGRFATDEGYMPAMSLAVRGVLKKAGRDVKDIQKVVFSSAALRESSQLAKKLGFIPEQVQDTLMLQVGNCGTAQPLLLLVAALEEAKVGDLILMAAYGGGADAFIFRVTDNIKKIQEVPVVRKYLENHRALESYNRYLSFRGLLETIPGEPFRTFPSNSAYWREQKSILRFYGSKCKQCGASIFPVNRICYACGSKDEYEEIRFSDRKAKVFTYSIDNLAGRSDDPVVVQTVAEDNEGTRYYLLMTDFDQTEVKIGMDIEFTFRKIYEGGNYINYYWKCRPVRNGGISK
jgi:3-hydroxy-3-methylglutaryl CoA synthase